MDQRYGALLDWLETSLQATPDAVTPVAGDASFRRYFRVKLGNETHIAMDAPPEKEGSDAFLALACHWHRYGLHVPAVLETDLAQGFLLLEDLGDDLYLHRLSDEATADLLYGDALEALIHIQPRSSPPEYTQPDYDAELLEREMQLFPDWLLEKSWACICPTRKRRCFRPRSGP